MGLFLDFPFLFCGCASLGILIVSLSNITCFSVVFLGWGWLKGKRRGRKRAKTRGKASRFS